MRTILVFGNNQAGRHGASAALHAQRFRGAKRSVRFRRSGDSFAIPTKDRQIKTLPLAKVAHYIQSSLEYASAHPELGFKVTAVGCGLAGFRHDENAPLFAEATANCLFDETWKLYLGEGKCHWGRFS